MKANIDDVKNFWDSRPCNINHSKKELGSQEAKKMLGLMCLTGTGVEQDIPKAKKCLAEFAQTGDGSIDIIRALDNEKLRDETIKSMKSFLLTEA